MVCCVVMFQGCHSRDEGIRDVSADWSDGFVNASFTLLPQLVSRRAHGFHHTVLLIPNLTVLERVFGLHSQYCYALNCIILCSWSSTLHMYLSPVSIICGYSVFICVNHWTYLLTLTIRGLRYMIHTKGLFSAFSYILNVFH